MTNNPPAITFLFTDIEGSTQLWEKYPDAMQVALARHDALLHQAIENNHGCVFKTVGDAFYAVFYNASDAVAAALAAQRALCAEDWGEAVIKVRMALHIGAVDARDGDYFGPPLNRVARLLSAGHGGQTLLSAAVEEAVRGHLPPGAELRNKGEWRLKDLTRPEHIYQLLAPGLPSEFPPLKTLEAFRTNLPTQLTSFIGREKEIAAVKQLITTGASTRFASVTSRLTTLTGPGGTGKTRLSLQVAADLLDSFPDGVWLIELAPLADPALVTQTVTTTLGLREEAGRSLLDVLIDHLRAKMVLLILDNCEHLVDAAAQLAETLLQACPNLHLLVSSREALGIPGETAYRVPSLSIPDIHKLPSVEMLTQYEAARLFIDRAKTALPGFAITDENAAAIAQVCSRLDGIPLAIELAAARVKMLKVEQIAERLDDRFRLLTGGSRTALPRQQTLRALIDWSYDLLSEPERALLRRLSVFSDGWTLEAAEQVCSDKGEDGNTKDEVRKMKDEETLHLSSFILHPFDVLEPLTQLINKSLVMVDADIVPAGQESAETRYRMLETIRQYAREKLTETGEGMTVRDLHLQYFLGLAERAEPQLTGPQAPGWMKRLDQELDNIRAALEWSMKQDAQVGLRLANALMYYWGSDNNFQEGIDWLSQLLRQPAASVRNATRAQALTAVGWLHFEPPKAQPFAEQGLALYRELGDQRGIAFALFVLGYAVCLQDDYATGIPLTLESLALFRKLNDKLGMAQALNSLGVAALQQDYDQAYGYLAESLEFYRVLGWSIGIAFALLWLGQWAYRAEDYASARAWLTESLEILRRLGSWQVAFIIGVIGELSLREGNYDQARACLEESLYLTREGGHININLWSVVHLGYVFLRQNDLARARSLFIEVQQRFKETASKIGVVYALEGLTSLAVAQDRPGQAAQLFAWADAMREDIGDTRPRREQADVDRDLAAIHTQLDDAAFAAAQTAGRAISMDEAIALAIESTHG